MAGGTIGRRRDAVKSGFFDVAASFQLANPGKLKTCRHKLAS
jgi:hypothetical protein